MQWHVHDTGSRLIASIVMSLLSAAKEVGLHTTRKSDIYDCLVSNSFSYCLF